MEGFETNPSIPARRYKLGTSPYDRLHDERVSATGRRSCPVRVWLSPKVSARVRIHPVPRRRRATGRSRACAVRRSCSAPADRVGREGKHERHPVRLAERLALAQDAVVPRRRLDGEAERLKAADELANVFPHLGPGEGQLASFGTTCVVGDRRIPPLLRADGPSLRSAMAGQKAAARLDGDGWKRCDLRRSRTSEPGLDAAANGLKS